MTNLKTRNRNDYFTTDNIKSDLKRGAVRGAGATFLASFASYFIQMFGTIILARILAPNDFGLVDMAVAIFLFFKMFRNAGLTDATVQVETINHEQASTLFWINFAFGTALMLIFMSFSPLIAWFYKKPQLTLIAIIISLDFIFAGFSAQHRALLKRNMQFYRFNANETAGNFVSTVTAIVLALRGYGYWSLVMKPVAYAVSEAIGAWFLCSWRPSLPSSKAEVKHLVKFGMHLLGNYSVNYFSQNIDKVLIGRRYGAPALGSYKKAYDLFLAPAQQLSYPLTSVAVATLSRLNDNHEKYRHYYLNAISMLALVGIPISALLAIMGNDVILLLLGSQWKQTGKIFSVFSLGIGAQILYATHAWLHISLGKPDRWLRWNIIGTLVTICAFLVGLPYGAFGVAASYTVSIFILTGVGLWYAGIPINLKLSSITSMIWKYCIAAITAALLCWYVINLFGLTSQVADNIHIGLRIAGTTFIYVTIYLFFIVVLYRGTKPLNQFFSLLREMKRK